MQHYSSRSSSVSGAICWWKNIRGKKPTDFVHVQNALPPRELRHCAASTPQTLALSLRVGLHELPLTVPRFLISFPAFRWSDSRSVSFGHFSPTAAAKLSRAALLTSGFDLLNSSAQPAFALLRLDFSVLLANRNTRRWLASRGAGRAARGKAAEPPSFHSDGRPRRGHRA